MPGRLTYRIDTGRTFAEILLPLLEAVRRNVAIEAEGLGDESLRAWRGATPRVSGDLRRSETVHFEVSGEELSLSFRVRAPGSEYYDEVAIKYPKLRGMKAAISYFDDHVDEAIDRAIDRALEETA